MRLPLLLLLVAACQRHEEEPCDELSRHAPAGVVLATESHRCAELVEFGARTAERYGMEFSDWLQTVPRQRVELGLATMMALSERHDWQPTSFGPEPRTVPCASAVTVTDEYWHASVLSRVLTSRPDHLYVSLSLEIASDNKTATIRIHHDFDCDHIVGIKEYVGEFRRDLPAFAGGWKLIRSTAPPMSRSILSARGRARIARTTSMRSWPLRSLRC